MVEAPPRSPTLLSRLRRPVTFLLVTLVLLAGLILAVQRTMLFPIGMMPRANLPAPDIEGLETLWVDTPSGRTEAWFVPALGVPPGERSAVVVFAHGNGELIDDWPLVMAEYRRWGMHLFLPEYRGYGRSAGSPSQAAIGDDFRAFHAQLVARDDVDPTRIVYHGRSLGSGALCDLGRDHPPAALVLQSAFTSVARMAWKHYRIPAFLVLDTFDNRAFVETYAGPVLVIHGEQDDLVSFDQGEELARLARQGQLVPFAANHNNLFPDERYWNVIRSFLEAAGILGDA